MRNKDISNGVVHDIPDDMKRRVSSTSVVYKVWEDITPLARNEWICWIEGAKKQETRRRRIKIMSEQLKQGKRRPCCWAGCQHR